MGTRCLTRVFDSSQDGEREILCLYRQFDGYPDGHGKELGQFVSGLRIIDGIRFGLDEQGGTANGMGCLAAQLVAHFKLKPRPGGVVGGFYIHAPGTKNVGEDYVYEVRADRFRCLRIEGFDETYREVELYNGLASGFAAACETLEAQED